MSNNFFMSVILFQTDPCLIHKGKPTFHRPLSSQDKPSTDEALPLPTRHVAISQFLCVNQIIISSFVQTENTEKYEIDESSEFLQPVDSAPVIVDEDDYQVSQSDTGH